VNKCAGKIKAGSVVKLFCMILPAVCFVYVLRFAFLRKRYEKKERSVYEISSSLSRPRGQLELLEENHKETTKQKVQNTLLLQISCR
jgi:hypothetical protein